MSTDFRTADREDEAYKAALERAEMLQGYYTHLLVYLVVNAGLFLINLLTKGDSGTWWFYWPMLGTGVAVAISAVVLLGMGGVFGTEWEQRQIDRYVRQHHPQDRAG